MRPQKAAGYWAQCSAHQGCWAAGYCSSGRECSQWPPPLPRPEKNGRRQEEPNWAHNWRAQPRTQLGTPTKDDEGAGGPLAGAQASSNCHGKGDKGSGDGGQWTDYQSEFAPHSQEARTQERWRRGHHPEMGQRTKAGGGGHEENQMVMPVLFESWSTAEFVKVELWSRSSLCELEAESSAWIMVLLQGHTCSYERYLQIQCKANMPGDAKPTLGRILKLAKNLWYWKQYLFPIFVNSLPHLQQRDVKTCQMASPKLQLLPMLQVSPLNISKPTFCILQMQIFCNICKKKISIVYKCLCLYVKVGCPSW